MVQALIWAGSRRPIKLAFGRAGFSGAVPAANDTIEVWRDGSRQTQLEVVRRVPGNRALLCHKVLGNSVEADDEIRFGTSTATVKQADYGGYMPGDLVCLMPDGLHPGFKIVSGPNWDDPVDSGRHAIIDVTTTMKPRQFWRRLADRLATRLGLPGTPARFMELYKVLRIDRSALPAAVRASLQSTGRAAATPAQFYSVLDLEDGVTLRKIRRYVTNNGEQPGLMTDYLP